ncbi:unnamed protein product [Orchesella dallaii]|uniref:Uncharacterized protein n=1 Tax=Orchesella dallaii TaxID=48710 RepID=A0ABP1QKG5_9HEXA
MRTVREPAGPGEINLFDLISEDTVSIEEFDAILSAQEAHNDQLPEVAVIEPGNNSEETWDDILTMFAEAFTNNQQQPISGSDSVLESSASGFMEMANSAADQPVDQSFMGVKLLESAATENVNSDEENLSDLSTLSPETNMSSNTDSDDFDACPPEKRFRPSCSSSEGGLTGSNSHVALKL